MEPISIDGTAKTPSVKFDAETGVMEIKGRSIPENSIEFYKPLVDWLDEYADSAKDKTIVNVQLEYFNTSSSKCILDVFKKLESLPSESCNPGVSYIDKGYSPVNQYPFPL
jgi:hypothetical protein